VHAISSVSTLPPINPPFGRCWLDKAFLATKATIHDYYRLADNGQ
jgi:hypothetical protein